VPPSLPPCSPRMLRAERDRDMEELQKGWLRRHTLMVMCTTAGNLRERFVKRPIQTSTYDPYGPWRGHSALLMRMHRKKRYYWWMAVYCRFLASKALHCTLHRAEHLVFAISAMDVDLIDTHPAGIGVNSQRSEAVLCLPRFWAPQCLVRSTCPIGWHRF